MMIKQMSFRAAPAAARRPSTLLAATALLALAGCAQLSDVTPDTPLAQVEQQFGAPTSRCPLPGGGERLVWSQQPFGHYAWGARSSADGRIGPIEPLLNDQAFERLDSGHWTPERIRCEFGPPALIEQVGLPSVRQEVWAYRYRQNGVWFSLMHLYMGRDGQALNRRHAAPDPAFDPRESNDRSN